MSDGPVQIYTDGASRGNPGKAAWAYLFIRGGSVIGRDTGFIGISTNNQAEYHAVIKALEAAAAAGYSIVSLYSDSELVIRQVRGEYRVKAPSLIPLLGRVRELERRFRSISFHAVPRKDSSIALADRMCNETLDAHGQSRGNPRGANNAPPPSFSLIPIGRMRTPFRARGDAPRQGRNAGTIGEIHIDEAYAHGLEGIEACRYLIVLAWFDRSDRRALTATPPGTGVSRGVFSTRSPDRPNPVGIELVELIERRGNVLKVRGVDALDGTPVIDIKPYSPGIDSTGSG
jgi:tRNA-Thr(GGU) m(6)t(6)A37 methyltransferase TsaA